MIKNIRHSAIISRNLDNALKFYVDILGLTIIKRDILKGKDITELLRFGTHKVELEYIKLAPKEGNVVLEILYFIKPEDFYYKCGGLEHISFTVNNLDEIIKKLEDNKVTVLSKPKIVDKNKIVFCRDFEGFLVELCEEKND